MAISMYNFIIRIVSEVCICTILQQKYTLTSNSASLHYYKILYIQYTKLYCIINLFRLVCDIYELLLWFYEVSNSTAHVPL